MLPAQYCPIYPRLTLTRWRRQDVLQHLQYIQYLQYILTWHIGTAAAKKDDMIGVDRVGGQGDSALTIQISQAGWTDVIYLSIYLSI